MDSLQTAGDRRWRQVVMAACSIQGLLLLAMLLWLLTFPAARSIMEEGEALLRLRSAAEAQDSESIGTVLWCSLFAGAGSLAAMVAGLLWGPPAQRSFRSWFIVLALCCGWLALIAGWKDLYWWGQSRRVHQEIAAAKRLADSLAADWPHADGDDPRLGFVLGYPKDDPTILLLAGAPKALGDLRIGCVERSHDRQRLRFQLVAPNADTWLVWAPTGVLAEGFASSFATHYELVRQRQLAPQWYLASYATGLPRPGTSPH